jgi:hypothetical protein
MWLQADACSATADVGLLLVGFYPPSDSAHYKYLVVLDSARMRLLSIFLMQNRIKNKTCNTAIILALHQISQTSDGQASKVQPLWYSRMKPSNDHRHLLVPKNPHLAFFRTCDKTFNCEVVFHAYQFKSSCELS